MKRNYCLMILMLLLYGIQLYAQQGGPAIKGTVTNQLGEPLPGTTIAIAGKNNSAIADNNGVYTLNAIAGDTLIFSAAGYEEKRIQVGSGSIVDISLVPVNNSLDGVVVIGYGKQSRKFVTGAVSKTEIVKDVPNTSITQSLRGRVAGVQFTDNGRPGQNGTILIRGPRSLSAGNNPLIVVDGIIYNGVLSDINPNDIESMEVLKDASASAIYGSRAANGVILISSRRGTTEKPTINVNTFTSISSPGYKIKLLTPERYVQKILDARKELGQEADPAKIASYLAPNEAENYLAGRTVDPYDVATQDGAGIRSIDLNMAGKTQRTNYFISASFNDEKGIILNDRQKRTTFRVNLENKITNWFTVGTNTMYGRRDFSGVLPNMDAFYQLSPYGSIYNEDGSARQFVVDGETVAGNPLYAPYFRSNQRIQNNLFANFYGIVQLPFVQGLSYRINISPNIRWVNAYDAARQDTSLANNTKSASKSNTNYYDWMIENILTYNKKINKANHIDVTLLYSRNSQFVEATGANATLLSSDVLGWNNLGLGETQTVSSSSSKIQGVSYMARINYRLMDKYLATFTIRRDGSSVFSENHKYAVLPSGALSWIVSEEGFLKNSPVVDLLKLRLSYGAVGNQAISAYQSLSKIGTQRYVYGDGGTTSLAYYPMNMANSDLKWETTYSTNIGLDFELLKGRIGGTIEYYHMKTKDLLVTRDLPRMTGFTSVWTNLGQVDNSGIEITLNTSNIRTKDFEWRSSVTFSNNKNRIVHLYGSDTDGDGKEDDDIGNRWFIGQPIYSYFDYVFDGIYQEGDTDIPSGYKPGYVRVKDINGDGVINADDRTIIGQGQQPKIRWGLLNDFSYKGLTLSVFLNGMSGWISDFGLIGRGPVERSLNFIDYGWWTPENKSSTRPSLFHENKYGHNYYLSRNFVRIQDVALSYNFSRGFLDRVKVSNLKVFVAAKNLYTFTNWIGADPESGQTSRDNLYPMPRTISVGLNLGF
ncbi:TonB-dependent receptor [Niabella yanshanensis]|uniref:TonB-dependent receptor n=1 Tax=Niabella yanshanensis TaxID=577386 RepID=A0ABZ0WAI9_9BACT|nr:TonB-dependent receptor [Niabella yanshanensis]WQD38567.1 TonB-dependent receptor [Niabella yanshanensis]